jgi:hypothetical protein
MIYDCTEPNGGYPFLKFDIATDDVVIHQLRSVDTEELSAYLDHTAATRPNDTALILFLGIFNNLHECDSFFEDFNKFYISVPNPVIVFNGSLTPGDYTVEPIFPYHRLGVFDLVSNLYVNNLVRESIPNPPTTRHHKFYWASTKDLYTRRYLLAKIIERGLLTDNLVNYKCIHTVIPSNYLNIRFRDDSHEEIIGVCESIADQIPLPPLDDTDSFIFTPVNFYTDSYLGIVTDTFYEQGTFLSEKVFNAINFYQMFVYLGPPHTLKYMRGQGYQTFGHVIDESYDAIEDNADRLFAFTRIVTDFLSQPIDKIHQAHVQCISQLEHNRSWLQQQRPDLAFTEFTRQALTK